MAAGEGGETWRAPYWDERKSADRSCNTDRGRASEGGRNYPLSALIAGAAIRGPRSAMADGGGGDVRVEPGSTGFGGRRRRGVKPPDIGRSAGAPTVGLMQWQSFAKNFMFFVRRR